MGTVDIIILILALLFVGLFIYNKVRSAKGKGCSGCSGCQTGTDCSGCEFQNQDDIKKDK